MSDKTQTSLLFVCMGNICRSPTAHGVMRHLLEEQQLTDSIRIDSAGTHAYHTNEPPDRRAQAAALNRGIDISDLRARIVELNDYQDYDLIVAMDYENLALLERMSPPDSRAKLVLMLDYASDWDSDEVPDPYYGGNQGFETVLDMLQDASKGLLA
ncbi:MAG: low molecular weight protein-tyrosine-phosphatase, partial [Gammaproteobacteria bacterium]